MSPLKRFNALKKVTAKPMTRQEYNDLRGWDLPANENGADDGYITVDINAPSNLEGWGGYVSWTPKEIFNNQFYEADDQPAGAKCTAPQNPDHVLTEEEITQLSKTDSLCDCGVIEFTPDDQAAHPIKQGDHVDFGTALHLMELGERVQRAGWNGKGMFVCRMLPSECNDLNGNKLEHSEYLALKTADNKILPWTISQSDALAIDWCLA